MLVPEIAELQAEAMLGSDYTSFSRLPRYLIVLLDEAVKKVNPVTATPIQYLKAIIHWKKLMIFMEQHFDNISEDETRAKHDHILMVDLFISVLDTPWDSQKISFLKNLLDDLTDGKEVLEKVNLKEYKVSAKQTLDDLRKSIMKNAEVLKVCAKVMGIDQSTYEATHMPIILEFDNWFLLHKDTHLSDALANMCSRTMANGMAILYEVNLPLSRKRRSATVNLARIAMAMFHEQVNFIKRVLRDEMRVFAKPTADKLRTDVEYFLEKQLFARYNFHHVLADNSPNNRSLMNKLARVVLAPERWNELHFHNTIKNMMSQIVGKDACGYDELYPSFKKFKGEQDWDETIMMLKREDMTQTTRKGSMDEESLMKK